MAQFRTLTARVRSADISRENRDLTVRDLVQLGYSAEMATRILSLLSDTQQLEYYLAKGRRSGCVPVTRAGERYPIAVRKRLGEDSPGCLWAKGDLSLLDTPCISLVGSRDLRPENLRFAQTVGLQAAKQGYTLVSGNARGADKTAQEACLAAGGSVICIAAGDRDGREGVFCHGGHVMNVIAEESDGRLVILDPSQAPDKFDTEYRRDKVEIKFDHLILCKKEILAEECAPKGTPYHLYWRK